MKKETSPAQLLMTAKTGFGPYALPDFCTAATASILFLMVAILPMVVSLSPKPMPNEEIPKMLSLIGAGGLAFTMTVSYWASKRLDAMVKLIEKLQSELAAEKRV